eukprot:CAMPEP_0197232682 /NCGR_PEP_ID=MMETSP1429-20130617/920_1 /TAXON_ID=49237 /ORGANISM="Chaetoceros  sp., Strain UNC1202" /LENGTH=74 /DNA_ID=CAMNT_0042690777 /DNA_START=161 /DNA_END=385 /DNA_ORIENTATION=-
MSINNNSTTSPLPRDPEFCMYKNDEYMVDEETIVGGRQEWWEKVEASFVREFLSVPERAKYMVYCKICVETIVE